MHFDLVVTRHNGLLQFLSEEGHTWAQVATHIADPSQLDGLHVLGVLPVNLAARCASFTELVLELPAEMRGRELTAEETRQFSRGLRTFTVHQIG